MKKGKFGIVLCFYPILAFAAVILQAFWLCALVLAVAVFLEKDEWTGRQTLQAGFLAAVVWFFSNAFRTLASLVPIPFLSDIVRTVATVLSVIVYLGGLVLSILAITRVMKEQEADLPLLSDLAHRVYGKRPAKPVSYSQPYGQPPVPSFYRQTPEQPAQSVPNNGQTVPPRPGTAPQAEVPAQDKGEGQSSQK